MKTWITDNEPSSRYPVYTRANAGEVLPYPLSPLGWTLPWLQALALGWRDSQITAGTFNADEFPEQPLQVVASLFGHFYINGSVSRIFGVRTPGLSAEIIDATYFGGHPDVPPYVPHDGDENAECSEKLTVFLGGVMTAQDLPQLRADQVEAQAARDGRGDLSARSDAELVARARGFMDPLRRFFETHILMTAASGVGPQAIAAIGDAVGDPSITMRLLAGIGDVDSAAPSWAMWALSRQANASAAVSAVFDAGHSDLYSRLRLVPECGDFVAAIDDFLVHHGSRGPNEWDIRSTAWELTPDLVLALIDRMRSSSDDDAPDKRNALVAADRTAVYESVSATLADNAEALGTFQMAVTSSALHMAGRERCKTNMIKVLHEVRMAFRELADRHGLTMSELCMLTDSEIDQFIVDPTPWPAIAQAREVDYLSLFDLDVPFIVNGELPVPAIADLPRRGTSTVSAVAAGDVLTGLPGCPGIARGRARVILDPADPFALEPGEVLIAPFTDPAWTPLFVSAGAVIVDVGALVSHAVIVSRELGIPCVVSCTDATRRIPDGALIEVNGHSGQVTIIEL
jgi:rifampicin phosphotransferase